MWQKYILSWAPIVQWVACMLNFWSGAEVFTILPLKLSLKSNIATLSVNYCCTKFYLIILVADFHWWFVVAQTGLIYSVSHKQSLTPMAISSNFRYVNSSSVSNGMTLCFWVKTLRRSQLGTVLSYGYGGEWILKL